MSLCILCTFFSKTAPPILMKLYTLIKHTLRSVTKDFYKIPFINKKVLLIHQFLGRICKLANVRICVPCPDLYPMSGFVSHVWICIPCLDLCPLSELVSHVWICVPKFNNVPWSVLVNMVNENVSALKYFNVFCNI